MSWDILPGFGVLGLHPQACLARLGQGRLLSLGCRGGRLPLCWCSLQANGFDPGMQTGINPSTVLEWFLLELWEPGWRQGVLLLFSVECQS